MEREQIEDRETFTLRIPPELNKSIKEFSSKIGISQNSLILLFINIGIKSYSDIILHQREEFLHFLSQIQK